MQGYCVGCALNVANGLKQTEPNERGFDAVGVDR